MRKNKTKRPTRRAAPPKSNGKASKGLQLPPPSPLMSRKSRKLIKLIQSWMEDESGYDEETWPQLQEALKKNRTCI